MSARSDRSVPEEQAKPAAGDIVLFEDLNEGAADMAATDEAGVAQDQVDGPEPADPMDQRELHAIIEALLFVSHGPVTFDRLAAVLDGGLQLVTRPDYGPWIKRLEKSKPAPKLSRSALESLAIIAYKQPIVRAEIEQIRGVETSGVIRTLLERKLVRMVGRKDVPGRPIMYGTTKYFLQHFGLRDLAELPPLREFKELGESEQAMLPVGDEPLVMTATPESGAPADELSPEVEETV
jgi:segregation and condensation protein B